jgi:hypothetical protein
MKPSQILINGLIQARANNAPAEMVARLEITVLRDALERIAKLGGHQGELAKSAIESVSETNQAP